MVLYTVFCGVSSETIICLVVKEYFFMFARKRRQKWQRDTDTHLKHMRYLHCLIVRLGTEGKYTEKGTKMTREFSNIEVGKLNIPKVSKFEVRLREVGIMNQDEAAGVFVHVVAVCILQAGYHLYPFSN